MILLVTEKHKSKHNDDSDTEIRNHKSYHDEKPSKKHEHKSRNHSEERSSKKHKQTDSDSSKHKNHKSDKHDKDNVNKHKTDEKSKSSHEKKHSKHPKDHKHKEKNERKRKHDDDEPSSSKKKRYESDSDENSSHLYETSQNVKPPEEEEKPRSSKHKHHKSEKERSRNGHDDKKPKSTEKSKSKEPTKSSHGEEKGKRSEKRDKHSEKSKKSSKIKNVSDEDGIDCGSGASFAEALGRYFGRFRNEPINDYCSRHDGRRSDDSNDRYEKESETGTSRFADPVHVEFSEIETFHFKIDKRKPFSSTFRSDNKIVIFPESRPQSVVAEFKSETWAVRHSHLIDATWNNHELQTVTCKL